ncbi:MAG: AlpA family phage regulatory protein [Deltaproteobacteria bacterium]|nr:AlpA family phage regulatory protein [Deltaproteobacteria bacterium]
MELLRPKHVIQKMKISRAVLYRLIQEGIFPKPVKIGSMSFWLSSEVDRIMLALYRKENKETLKKIVREIERSRQDGDNQLPFVDFIRPSR